jgi:hypothetical protein
METPMEIHVSPSVPTTYPEIARRFSETVKDKFSVWKECLAEHPAAFQDIESEIHTTMLHPSSSFPEKFNGKLCLFQENTLTNTMFGYFLSAK